MSLLTARGGVPWIWRGTTGPQALYVPFATGNSNYLKIRPDKDVKVYFTATDAQAGNGKYVLAPAGGEWAGPADVNAVWLISALTANVELCAFIRFN